MKHAGVYVWPSSEQQLLLEAGLLDRQRAVDAFQVWRNRVRLEDDFSAATLRLLRWSITTCTNWEWTTRSCAG
jgi:hypothetical protein